MKMQEIRGIAKKWGVNNKPPRRKRTGYYPFMHAYYAASDGE